MSDSAYPMAWYYTTSRTKLEIKPCPFCGNDKFLVQTYDGKTRVSCNRCSARGPISDIENPRDGDAIVAWNKRIGESGEVN